MFLLPCKKTLLHCCILITATHGLLPSKQSPPPPHPFPVLSQSISKSPGISYRLLLPLPRIPLALAKLSFSASTASFYSHSATGLPLFFLLLSALVSTAVGAGPKSSNITIIGSVFCDFYANNSFSKHSYFLHGIFSLSLSLCISLYLAPPPYACMHLWKDEERCAAPLTSPYNGNPLLCVSLSRNGKNSAAPSPSPLALLSKAKRRFSNKNAAEAA